MPAVKNVGEPCAGEPHARFDGGREETRDNRPRRATPGASRLPDQPRRAPVLELLVQLDGSWEPRAPALRLAAGIEIDMYAPRPAGSPNACTIRPVPHADSVGFGRKAVDPPEGAGAGSLVAGVRVHS